MDTKGVEEKSNNVRIFGSRVAGSSYFLENGNQIIFTKGWYETSDPQIIRELDLIANKSPLIFIPEHEKELIQKLQEARDKGFQGDLAAVINASLAQHVIDKPVNAVGETLVNQAAAAAGNNTEERLRAALAAQAGRANAAASNSGK